MRLNELQMALMILVSLEREIKENKEWVVNGGLNISVPVLFCQLARRHSFGFSFLTLSSPPAKRHKSRCVNSIVLLRTLFKLIKEDSCVAY